MKELDCLPDRSPAGSRIQSREFPVLRPAPYSRDRYHQVERPSPRLIGRLLVLPHDAQYLSEPEQVNPLPRDIRWLSHILRADLPGQPPVSYTHLSLPTSDL